MSVTNRFQASFFHLVCSFIVAIFSLILVFLVWYPGLLAPATGVTEIFLIVLVVDVCLGPLLTLVVYNPKKKELKLDLFIIGSLQVAALLYGLYTVAIVRPVFVVFEIDRFQLVYANDLSKEKLAAATYPEYRTLPLLGPKWISSKLPDDIEEKNDFIFSVIQGGDDLGKTPKYYIPYEQSRTDIISRLSDLEDLRDFNTNNIEAIDELVAKYASESSNVGFVPLKGYIQDLTVIVNKTDAGIVEIVNLRPWGD